MRRNGSLAISRCFRKERHMRSMVAGEEDFSRRLGEARIGGRVQMCKELPPPFIFKVGSHHVVLAVLELSLLIRLALNS